DDPRPRQGRLSRRQAVLADLRARAGARRSALLPSIGSAAGGDGRLLQGLRQGFSDGRACRLGLHGRNGDARDQAGARRGVRRLSPAQGRSRPSRGDAAVPWRVDQALARPGAKTLSFRGAFCGHFYITTSGNFSNPALLCCLMERGMARIMLAVDWLCVANKRAVKWMETVPLCDEDKTKILSGNARRLLKR